ncbi:hypothetical protein TNIN_428551 [Trichonephila inaurata madagascariensis]|uniref:Uncharacterized protein n=1 Tax=Trichonephila inaurata madagascariensis TaxID=2747483 RepID=A0A8X6J4J8_9ARAC|nr:hypothetical protein TNIN_360381 [Trichonephila inaurata madagascariensis]GFY56286.1 hypothetical protein TNIN_428551 [Trichonephila inaurata madagascariensis]
MDQVSRCRTRILAPVYLKRTRESNSEFNTNRTLMSLRVVCRLWGTCKSKIGDRIAETRDREDIEDQRSSSDVRQELTCKERLFMCWPDRDGENEWSLLEHSAMRRISVEPTPSREATTRRFHNG